MRRYVIETDGTVEQFRFPRSRKARIRRKWQMRSENWREVDLDRNCKSKLAKIFLGHFFSTEPNRNGDAFNTPLGIPFVDEDGEDALRPSSFMGGMIRQMSQRMNEAGTRLARVLSMEVSEQEVRRRMEAMDSIPPLDVIARGGRPVFTPIVRPTFVERPALVSQPADRIGHTMTIMRNRYGIEPNPTPIRLRFENIFEQVREMEQAFGMPNPGSTYATAEPSALSALNAEDILENIRNSPQVRRIRDEVQRTIETLARDHMIASLTIPIPTNDNTPKTDGNSQ